MLGARQDVRPVAAGSRAGGETPLGAGAGAELAAVPRRRQGEVFQLVLTVYPPRLQPPRRDSDWPGPSGGPARSSTAPARAFSAQNSRPHPLLFPIQPPRDTELSCVCLLWRPRFAAAASPRLSPSPAPLPDGLLCGSAESPTPFLCGITMAAGVSLPAPAIRVAVSDAILCRNRALRGQRSSGGEWGSDPGSGDRTVGVQGFQALEGN